MRPFIIDCDTGRDDALAIWLSLAMDMPVAGIVASYGNTTLGNVIDNSARVLSLSGHEDIPLLVGTAQSKLRHTGEEKITLPRQNASGNGLCNQTLPASSKTLPDINNESIATLANNLKSLVKMHGKLDYVVTGTATSLAALCDFFGDEISHYIAKITMMGGKFSPLWEAQPQADFNIIADPHAIDTLLKSSLEIRFVPMNFTWPIALTLEEVEFLKPQTEIAKTSQNLMIAHCKEFAPEPIFRFHDPCVLLAMSHEEHLQDVFVHIILDEASPEYGRLIERENGFKIKVLLANEALHASFLSKILSSLGFDDTKKD